MEFLHSSMDHPVFQWCRNYQLEEIRIKASETPDELIEQICGLANRCNFPTDVEKERHIQFQMVHALSDTDLIRKLLAMKIEATTAEMLTVCHTHIAITDNMNSMGLSTKAISAVQKMMKKSSTHSTPCGNCTKHHTTGREHCPAKDSTCHSCQKIIHWKQKCRKSNKAKDAHKKPKSQSQCRHRGRRRADEVGVSEGDPAFDEVMIHAWLANQKRPEDLEKITLTDISIDAMMEAFATVDMPVASKKRARLWCKVDTGAGGNVMPLWAFAKLFPNRLMKTGMPTGLRKCNTKLRAYNGKNIPQLSALDTPITWKDEETKEVNKMDTTFYVANTPGPAILELPSCSRQNILNLNCSVQLRKHGQPIKVTKEREKDKQDMKNLKPINSKDDLIKAYPDRFEGIGKFPGTYHIYLKEDAIPVVHTPWKCPIAIWPLVDKKLDKLLEQEVIVPVTEPTDWVSSLAYSWKADGDLRTCLNPTHLNKAIRQDHYRTPTLEEITHELAGSTKFTKVDGSSSYYCIVLNYESSLLTTFNTHRGRFHFVHLPFGLICAQDIFQRMIDQILHCCEGVIRIADDIIIYGKDDTEHDRRLHKFMKVTREHGLVLNKKKCEVKSNSVKFFGCVYDKHRTHPDPSKVSAIKEMPDLTEQRRASELPWNGNISLTIYPTTIFSHSNTQRTSEDWYRIQLECYISSGIWQAQIIGMWGYNTEVLQHEETSDNPSWCIRQGTRGHTHPGWWSSCFHIQSTHTHRTALCKQWEGTSRLRLWCRSFWTYVFGRHFMIKSDHKSIEQISMKNLADAPVHLQRMLFWLQDYDFTINYHPGEEMVVADTLSRYSLEDTPEVLLDISVNHVYINVRRNETINLQSRMTHC